MKMALKNVMLIPVRQVKFMEKYNPKEIETKWQKIWADEKYGISENFLNRPKHYHLVEFPYPSAAGLHVGHCMGYGASDAYCRMKRMQGFNVMYPIGWDAFGLPTENYAIKTGVHPSKATADNVAIFKKQIKSLGYAFDWSREVNTSDPNYYRWTQWIFLQFYKHSYNPHQLPLEKGESKRGLVKIADDDKTTPRLAYQKEMPINWCPSCKIGLANEEVINGKCERCGTETEKRLQKQWLLRITAYADRLIDDLNTVDYLDKIKTQQINWIGRSEGAQIDFRITNYELRITVFTTRPDTLFGATFMAIAPEHEIIERLKNSITNYDEVLQYITESKKKSDLERTELAKEKTGIKIEGIMAINPVNNEEIPIFVADYVLTNYGTGAVMAVPAHDERDFEFAKKYDLAIKTVIQNNKDETEKRQEVFTGDGTLINSGDFDGLTSEKAKEAITEKLKEMGAGDFTVNYKLRDWIFSRQHYWGEPIPIIHCDKCGMVPMDEKDLPLTLPEVENYQPTDTGESPLAKITDWVNTTCPKCGGPAKRETDTMPNWAGSSWYFLRYCDPHNNDQLASMDKMRYWLGSDPDAGRAPRSPKELGRGGVDLYNGGMEHTTLHLLYSRFWHKFLYDLGVVPGPEPYAKRIAHGIVLGPDGQKMSKSRGNVINPDDMIDKFGADTLRAYIMFIGPYDQESAWSMAGIQGVYRFLQRVWNNLDKITRGESPPTGRAGPRGDSPRLLVKLNQTIAGVMEDLENFRMNTVVSKLMEMNNAIDRAGAISRQSFEAYLKLLFPACPHISEELWQRLGNSESIEKSEWPTANPKYLVAEKIEVVIQINGRVRDKIIVNSDISDEEMKKAALGAPKIKELIGGQEIQKVIVVPKKLVSFVTKQS